MADLIDATRAEAWRGAIPAIFSLAPDEVTTLQPPRPYHICLPRQTMLPFVCEAVRQHFAPYGPPMGGEMWFQHAGSPLRWQLPVGVLFDLMCDAYTEDRLPWRITVQFQSFPSNVLLRATRQEAEAVLLNALKESCYLRCGSAMPAMTLSPADQSKLADVLARTDAAYAEDYATVTARVEEGIGAQLRGEAPRAVPTRIFTSPTDWRQLPLPPASPGGAPTSLRDALSQALPAYFATVDPTVDPTVDEAAGSGEEALATAGRAAEPRVLVQGVPVPLHTPLGWLYSACAHPDGWLYVLVLGVVTSDQG